MFCACLCVRLSLHPLWVWVYMCLMWHNRGFRFLSVSFCVIVVNVPSWTQHTLSTVTRSHWPSVTGLPGLPYTVCPQAVAAIWFTNKNHSKVCPNFCTPRVSARTRLNFRYIFKEIAAKIRLDLMQIKCYLSFSMNREICQYFDFFPVCIYVILLFAEYISYTKI